MSLQRDKEIVDFIMEVDMMGTAEFCQKYNFPVPVPIPNDIPATAQQFLNVDMKRWHVIREFAKQVRRSEPNEKAQSAEDSKVRRAYSLFHLLWGDSKEKVYSKQLWSELQVLLSEIICIKPFRIHPDHKNTDQSRISQLESELAKKDQVLSIREQEIRDIKSIEHTTIIDLKSELAKSQEKCKALTDVLWKTLRIAKSFNLGGTFKKVIEEAEQALKPNQDENTKTI